MTGSIAGALRGAFSGGRSVGLAYGIGHVLSIPGGSVGKMVAHGAAQGGVSRLQGGKFSSGFVGGFFGHMTGGFVKGIGKHLGSVGVAMRTTAAAVVGGTISKLTGGKFANGAATAAFTHLFNHESGRRHFHTKRQTAILALNSAWQRAGGVAARAEWGGGIYRYADGTFNYTEPFTNGQETGIILDEFTITAPAGTTTVGSYHTHPVPSGAGFPNFINANGYRWGDIPSADALNWHSYVGNSDSSIMHYDPGTGAANWVIPTNPRTEIDISRDFMR